MSNLLYYGILIVFAFVAVQSFRNGHVMIGLIMLALAGWVYYAHEEDISYADFKHNIVEGIDEKARSQYESDIRNEGFEYNTTKVK